MARSLTILFVILTISVSNCFAATAWQSVGPSAGNIHSITLDPTNSKTVYCGADGAANKSDNSGGSWALFGIQIPSANFNAIAVANSQTVYYGTSVGVFYSDGSGNSWTLTSVESNTNAFAINPTNTKIVYAGTTGGVFKTANGGGTWINTGLSNVTALAHSPIVNNNATIYAGSNGGVFKSINDGGWISSGLTGTSVKSIVIDSTNSQTVYAGTSDGVFKTTNGGGSWTMVNRGMTDVNVQSLVIDPSNSLILYAGTQFGGVFKSVDGGASWSAIIDGMTNKNVQALAIDPTNSETVYAGTKGGGIYKSTVSNSAPGITSAAAATFVVGVPGTYVISTVGNPVPTSFGITGTIPNINFSLNTKTGVFSYTPAPGDVGTRKITFTASNGILPKATLEVSITVLPELPLSVTLTKPAYSVFATGGLTNIAGTASGAGLSKVEVQITDGTLYLQANKTFGTTPVWLAATGTTNWALDTSGVPWSNFSTYSIITRASNSTVSSQFIGSLAYIDNSLSDMNGSVNVSLAFFQVPYNKLGIIVEGSVKNSVTGNPVDGAEISVPGTYYSVFSIIAPTRCTNGKYCTGPDGNFLVIIYNPDSRDIFSIKATAAGYSEGLPLSLSNGINPDGNSNVVKPTLLLQPIDNTAPTVDIFDLPSTATSTTVTITTLTASDNSGTVSGYCLTETNNSNTCTWSTSKPTSYPFATAGVKTLFAFAKDAVGNISVPKSDIVTIDNITPTVDIFDLPATSASTTVTITTLEASDNSGAVSSYCLSETNNASTCTWSTSKPTSFPFGTAGSKTLNAFVKDASGNVSTSKSDSTIISTSTTGPSLILTTPANGAITKSATLIVSGTVSDPTGVATLKINNNSVTVTNGSFSYSVTLQEGANTITTVATNNLNFSTTDTRTITLDTTAPIITAFSLPAKATGTTFSVTLIVSDNSGAVASYCLTETNNSSGCTWSPTAPANYTFATGGAKTIYAFAKDSVGNISIPISAAVDLTSKPGDCDATGTVTITEVQSAINMFLGLKAAEACVDLDRSGAVSIAEVQKVINSFLGL